MTSLSARSLLALAAALAALSGCHLNPYYCPGANPDNNCTEIDASPHPACTSDSECHVPNGVCDTVGSKTCVQCTVGDAAACMEATPICGTDNQCRPCQADSECTTSQTCDATSGRCIDPGSVLYVSTTGTGNSCSLTQPCGQLMTALGLVTTDTKTIKLLPGSYIERVTIADTTVTIHGDGADLTEAVAGEIMRVQGSSNVSLLGLRIHDGLGGAGDGILCTNMAANNPTLALRQVTIEKNGSLGVDSTKCIITATRSTINGNAAGGISSSGGSLTVSQSTVSGNSGGGIAITGNTSFDIENNFITYNGLATGANASQTGGASILANTNGSKFEFNTVAFNQSSGLTFRGGASCNAPLASASFNLFFHNTEGDGGGGTKTDNTTQLNSAGGCPFGNTLAVPTDPGSLGFKSPVVVPFDFHLTAASPPSIVDAAGTCTGIDFDGDTRPIGKACDLGADEYRP